MKIGILTFFSSINYGAFLQAYALQNYLVSRFGDKASIEIIDYTSLKARQIYIDRVESAKGEIKICYSKQYEAFIEARGLLRLSSEKLISDDIIEFSRMFKDKYDIIVVGSDEIWKVDGMRGFPNCYWLNFDLGKTKLLSYAASGRNYYSTLNEDKKAYIKEALSKYEYIGVRDNLTKKELEKVANVKTFLNPDPTILLKNGFVDLACRMHSAIIEDVKEKSAGKKVLSIMISDTNVAKRLAEVFDAEFFLVGLFFSHNVVSVIDYSYISPFEWNEVISISDFIITDRYHGMLFSIIHGKPFVAVENESRGTGKIEDFVLRNNMEALLLYKNNYLNKTEELVCDIKSKINEGIISHTKDYDNIIINESLRAISFEKALEALFV